MSLSDSTDALAGKISGIIDSLASLTTNIVSVPVPHEDLARANIDYTVHINNTAAYKVINDESLPPAENDKTADQTTVFNESVEKSCREFVVLTAQSKVADSLLDDIVCDGSTSENGELPQEHQRLIGKLCVLLDVVIHLVAAQAYPSQRSDFFVLAKNILDTLFGVSTDHVLFFWTYVETRRAGIAKYIFDANATSHRISLLLWCNGLTDKYFVVKKQGKTDSYEKDSFNDVFQARVRLFLAEVFVFEDLTGLNKYFTLANRINKEPGILKSQRSDDKLLADLFQLYRFLRDPYFSLKNVRLLQLNETAMTRLANYLLEEEERYAKTHAKFLVAEPPSAATHTGLFFPESYWLTPFETPSRDDDSPYAAAKAADYDAAIKLLDSSKFRRLVLFQIFLAAHFLSQLLASQKKDTMAAAGAPPTAKHITEDSTPETNANNLKKLKHTISTRAKTWESRMGLLLEGLGHSEEQWWLWLLHGKDDSGKSIFSARNLTGEELATAKRNLAELMPEKRKRYFNAYATPQLSRKMKTRTGLALLEKLASDENTSFDEQIAAIDKKLAEVSGEEKNELQEQRTVLVWKRLKKLRAGNWLAIDTLVAVEELGLPEEIEKVDPEKVDPEKVEEEKEEKEEIAENMEESMDVDEVKFQEESEKRDFEEKEPKKESEEKEPKTESEDAKMDVPGGTSGKKRTRSEEPEEESHKRVKVGES